MGSQRCCLESKLLSVCVETGRKVPYFRTGVTLPKADWSQIGQIQRHVSHIGTNVFIR